MSDFKAQVESLIGYQLPPFTYEYTERDVSLYALGVGAPIDVVDQDELKFVYELSSKGFQALPTFPVIYGAKMVGLFVGGKLGDISYNPMALVHGEQLIEIHRPIPTSGKVICSPIVTHIYDKGSGMLVIVDTPCCNEAGEKVVSQQGAMFIRGLGNFGGERGSSPEVNTLPDRPPDAIHEQKTLPQQALIYRLSGDRNPLHADPAMAALGKFDRPILHGLCTMGFAGRAILRHMCANDPARFKRIRVRFSKHVFPGETLITEMWKTSDTNVVFRTKVAERNEVVLSQAGVEFHAAP